MVLRALSDEEKDARLRALTESRQREALERERAKEEAALRVVTDEVKAKEQDEAQERKRKEDARHAAEAEAKRTRRLVMIELHVLALVPLFAALMARGIGS